MRARIPIPGQPIIKAFLNPLVGWIWFGLVIIVFGTFIALVPSLTPATAALRVPAATLRRSQPRSREATDGTLRFVSAG